MRTIITDNERGFLFKNGIYQRMVSPGKNKINRLINRLKGEYVTIKVVDAVGQVDFENMNLTVLLKDESFKKSVVYIEVPDDKLAIRFVDGRIKGVLTAGRYAFWNIYEKNAFRILDMADPEDINELPQSYISYIPSAYSVYYEVDKGEVGLLFYDGAYQKTLDSGKYYFWNYMTKARVENVDTRQQQLDITGQEILTADKVSLRINFVCTYSITDPVSIVTKITDYKQQIYVLVQLTLRELAGRYRFDELLRQKSKVGEMICAILKEKSSELYIKFTNAGIKDIVLPGEVRDIMNTVLIAEKNAQASVITRREETAATKSLLDTAKLMEENATLFKLKELEYLERVCDKVGNISVGNENILDNLRRLVVSDRG